MQQRLLYYNAMIKPVLNYVSAVWTSCNKDAKKSGKSYL